MFCSKAVAYTFVIVKFTTGGLVGHVQISVHVQFAASQTPTQPCPLPQSPQSLPYLAPPPTCPRTPPWLPHPAPFLLSPLSAPSLPCLAPQPPEPPDHCPSGPSILQIKNPNPLPPTLTSTSSRCQGHWAPPLHRKARGWVIATAAPAQALLPPAASTG